MPQQPPPDPPPPPRLPWLQRLRPWAELLQRLRPWAELLHRLLAAIAAAIAIWKGLG
jgi:hypothetical protein